MDMFECSICENTFDGESHRPRALPCGHGFCTSCIEACINTGDNTCPVCRKGHGANSVLELPVSFLIEDLLHKFVTSASQNHKSVCHNCTVMDHSPSACNLISLDDEIKEKKHSQITTIREQKQVLMDAEKDLKMQLQGNFDYLTEQNNKKQGLEEEVDLMLTKIDQISQDILKKEQSQNRIKDAIQDSQKKQKSCDVMENKLRVATIKQDIVKQCEMTTAEIMKSQKWEETLRKELNVKRVPVVSEEVEASTSAKIMKVPVVSNEVEASTSAKRMKVSVSDDKYAQVVRNGIRRSCRVFIENGKTFVPCLSKEVSPPSSARLIKEAELGLSSASSIVFMDISACGHSLGRVIIQVLGNRPYGCQFLMLALGTEGQTFKGATFANNRPNYIVMRDYITESGMKSRQPLVTSLKKEHHEAPSRGNLFPTYEANSASFMIWIKSSKAVRYFGYFGSIITGMEVIDTIASDKYNISDVTITDCGIVLLDH